MIDRVPGVTPEQLQTLLDLLRKMAPKTVAYEMQQITGYEGRELPMQIALDTTARIFAPARRNWGAVELEIIDSMVRELILNGTIEAVVESDYACNPVLAMKRAPDGSWSQKRFCINFIPINRHTELDRYGSHKAEDLFKRVVHAKFLTALDLRSGISSNPHAPGQHYQDSVLVCVRDRTRCHS